LPHLPQLLRSWIITKEFADAQASNREAVESTQPRVAASATLGTRPPEDSHNPDRVALDVAVLTKRTRCAATLGYGSKPRCGSQHLAGSDFRARTFDLKYFCVSISRRQPVFVEGVPVMIPFRRSLILVAVITVSIGAGFHFQTSAQKQKIASLSPELADDFAPSEMRQLIEYYVADRGSLQRSFFVINSPARRDAFTSFTRTRWSAWKS
jgi:hypothetical protein